MDPTWMESIVRFHGWANERIMDTAAQLTDDQLRRAAGLDHETVFQTLRHLVDLAP